MVRTVQWFGWWEPGAESSEGQRRTRRRLRQWGVGGKQGTFTWRMPRLVGGASPTWHVPRLVSGASPVVWWGGLGGGSKGRGSGETARWRAGGGQGNLQHNAAGGMGDATTLARASAAAPPNQQRMLFGMPLCS